MDRMLCRALPVLKLAFGTIVVMLCVSVLWTAVVQSTRAATASGDGQSQTVGGLTLYLGFVPAEIVKGFSARSADAPMHGATPKGAHEYHVVVAIFDAATGVRISDAIVTAQVSGLGLAGTRKRLDPMEIANTITYGAFFSLPGLDLYTVRVTVERLGGARPVVAEFTYDHRWR